MSSFEKKKVLKNIDLTILIPCYNEAEVIAETLNNIITVFKSEKIKHEILCVNNACTDLTESILKKYAMKYSFVRYINTRKKGYGIAIKAGLKACRGDAVVTVMADSSENPKDIVAIYKKLNRIWLRLEIDLKLKNHKKLPQNKIIFKQNWNKALVSILGGSFDDLHMLLNAIKLITKE